MRADQIEDLRPDGERIAWMRQYIRNAMAALKHVETNNRTLAGHILDAEQALRKALHELEGK